MEDHTELSHSIAIKFKETFRSVDLLCQTEIAQPKSPTWFCYLCLTEEGPQTSR